MNTCAVELVYSRKNIEQICQRNVISKNFVEFNMSIIISSPFLLYLVNKGKLNASPKKSVNTNKMIFHIKNPSNQQFYPANKKHRIALSIVCCTKCDDSLFCNARSPAFFLFVFALHRFPFSTHNAYGRFMCGCSRIGDARFFFS